jgi:hypothetical protein
MGSSNEETDLENHARFMVLVEAVTHHLKEEER